MSNKKFQTDEELIHYIQTLKGKGGDYPSELLEKQRSSYMGTIKNLVGFMPMGGFLKFIKNLVPHTTEGILQTILVGTVVLAAGTTGYLFRENIRDWLTPEVVPYTEQITTPITPSPCLLTQEGTLTPTPEASFTILPTLPSKMNPTDQGNHYGQTRTPKP